ncbi:MAG: tetratricopeptide repeat protein, partial [Chloroherpetonaceae bacterium]
MSEELAPIFLVEAEKFIENRDFDRAIELCKRGIEYFPDYYLGYVLLTEALESVGNFEQADRIFETATIRFANNLFFREIARRRSKFGRLLIQEAENSNNISADSFSN